MLALARAEERHAAHWAAKLHPAERPPSEPGRRSRLLGWLARRLGSLVVFGLAQRAEAGGHNDSDAEGCPTSRRRRPPGPASWPSPAAGVRQSAMGAAAALLTYALGRAFGATLG
jgi:hypothetical protein